jgi:predicted small integral membrane protein
VNARVASIDVMRGLVMMIMMVDHVRETFFLRHQVVDPMDLAETAPALFFSRLAAHFCAPLFVFLTGLSAWLYAHPASGPRSATGFLFKRGLFLIALELGVISVAWTGRMPPPTIYLQVIWAIGLVDDRAGVAAPAATRPAAGVGSGDRLRPQPADADLVRTRRTGLRPLDRPARPWFPGGGRSA